MTNKTVITSLWCQFLYEWQKVDIGCTEASLDERIFHQYDSRPYYFLPQMVTAFMFYSEKHVQLKINQSLHSGQSVSQQINKKSNWNLGLVLMDL